jgi:AAA15 family ATPase/GTPase
MLSKFTVKDFKNFEHKLVFDLSNTKDYEFNPECIKHSIVNKAIIYGPNSSGKSNLGFAIFDIISHLTDKEKNPRFYANFLFGGDLERVAEFEYFFRFGKSELKYYYGKKSQDEIVFENLWIDSKLVAAIDKRKDQQAQIDLKGTETLNRDMKNTKISVIKYILSNAVLDHDDPVNDVLLTFGKFVEKMLFFRSVGDNAYLGFETGVRSTLDDIIEKDHLSEFESFLNSANVKCNLCVDIVNEKKTVMNRVGNKKINFLDTASTGTRSLTLFYYWLQRLQHHDDVSFLFIDEYDAYYHYGLSRSLVQLIKKIEAQTILTTHNTSIMSNDLLRPDSYFILEDNAIKPIFEFTDKELRQAHNIEKMYRAGAFQNG